MSLITGLEIENYRGFKHLRVEGLSRVNLIVGKNNSGKTSLLEAVEAVASGRSPYRLSRGSFERGEWRATIGVPNSVDIDVRRWFHNHTWSSGARLSVLARFQRGDKPATLTYQLGDVPIGTPARNFVQGGLYLHLHEGSEALPLSPDGFLQVGSPLYFVPNGFGLIPPVGFVTTKKLNASDLSQLWPIVALTPQEQSTIAMLRLVEPSLERLAIFGGGDTASVQVLLGGASAPVPLSSLGEGASRLLTLALYLASTKGGFLLVDEIENGIHWSVMPKLWRFLVQAARELDVQIFASTHSSDCLRGIAQLYRDEPELAADISVHRLEAGRNDSVRMDARIIDLALDGEQEVR